MCYSSKASCHFYCGHSFCNTCVKEWYIKCMDTEAKCPMCRSAIYFNGMDKKVDEWEEEHWEQKFQNFFEKHLEELLEDEEVDELTMPILHHISKKISEMKEIYRGHEISEDFMEVFVFYNYKPDFIYTPFYHDEPTWFVKLCERVSKHPPRASKKIKGPMVRGHSDEASELYTFFVF